MLTSENSPDSPDTDDASVFAATDRDANRGSGGLAKAAAIRLAAAFSLAVVAYVGYVLGSQSKGTGGGLEGIMIPILTFGGALLLFTLDAARSKGRTHFFRSTYLPVMTLLIVLLLVFALLM